MHRCQFTTWKRVVRLPSTSRMYRALVALSCVCIACAFRPCLFELSVELTNETFEETTGKYVDDELRYGENDVFWENGTIRGCPCNIKPCVRKCCGETEEIARNKTCVPSQKSRDLLSDPNLVKTTNIDYVVIHSFLDCKERKRFSLTPGVDNLSVSYRGSLTWVKEIHQSQYCLDYYMRDFPIALVCEMEEVVRFYAGMIISMPFLVATFLVYALLPDRNLPAKALMCYVLSLLFAYIMLVIIQLKSNLQLAACNTIAFLCYFFFMASFFWMNSSCIDIWLTFSGIKGITGQRTQERKRFVYYCLYSWGLPLVMTMIVVIISIYPVNNSVVDTGIGNGQCWFQNGLPTGIYFYFPIAALLITNITLFITTALKIRNVQRDTKMLNAKDSSKHEKDKQRFNLYVKLLFAMGINWSMEVISWAVQWKLNDIPSWIWYITDFCNAMYGVLIFFIFVFKRNIWLMLKKRYLQFTGRPTQAHSMGTSTNRTTVSQVTSSEA